ncbi:MAG: Xaa-Pro dipeptidyl-peptidase [Gemmatimonadetes bacterium]|nr:Xaa-Pro dipeptidyl-peptidase [Gemmatimonadota bacterium]MDA1103056.1 Xaa-Pro dipeptidyl-peptidase [Gemmatimonadota bacterium]
MKTRLFDKRKSIRSFPCSGALVAGALLVAVSAKPGEAQSREPTQPVFVDGQAQVVPRFADPAFWVRHDLWVETEFDSDGDGRLDRVHVDVTRQSQTDNEGLTVPVIYESSPYFSGTGSVASEYFWNVQHEIGAEPSPRGDMPAIAHQSRRPVISNSHVADWVPRGFAVVHSQSPGTGLSQGCPTVGGINESLAPKAVIDWLNGRARGFSEATGGEEVEAFWATGRVGMTGTSYNGTLPLAAATTGVEGLEAIIPIAPNTSYYHYYRSNGLVRSPGGYLGEDVDVLYDFINSGNPERRAYCDATVRDGEMAAGQDRLTGDYNDFWAGRDYLNAIEGVKAATLMAHGFNDWNVMPEHSYRIYRALEERGVPAQIYYHQGGHGGPPPLDMMNRWFTRHLYDVDNGVEQDPRAWIVREGAATNAPTPYADYPNPEAESVVLRPQAGGNGVGLLSLGSTESQGVESLADDVSIDGAGHARASESSHRLLYATPELAQDVHLSGVASVTVRLAASADAANLSVWLVSLPWVDGDRITDNVITRGWADPQNRGSLTESAPLVPGEFYELTFDLQPDDQIIAAGQRIGLMIFSSDPEFTLWPEAGTELNIDLDGTSLSLPVVGGAEVLGRLIS